MITTYMFAYTTTKSNNANHLLKKHNKTVSEAHVDVISFSKVGNGFSNKTWKDAQQLGKNVSQIRTNKKIGNQND
jgi:peroxiredoxin